MSQHTPGPWVVNDGRNVLAGRKFIASVWFPEEIPDANEERESGESWADAYDRLKPRLDAIIQEMEANARLIATAPELLSSLEYLMADVRNIVSGGGWHSYLEASKAIAKAKGEA